jgi:hypothetical protein
MKTTILDLKNDCWNPRTGAVCGPDADLVLWFASPEQSTNAARFQDLRRQFPSALIAGCSTGGEIVDDEALDGSAVAAVIKFDKARVRGASATVAPDQPVEAIGRQIATDLAAADLKAVFVLSDGTNVNGTALVRGFMDVLSDKVVVTGGLAGDGSNFGVTRVGLDGPLEAQTILAVGFYGDTLEVTWGSAGGWEPFGPERAITKSRENVLLELDGKPALELYKQYLGDQAADLPGSALLFPLLIRPEVGSLDAIVRTIVSVDEDQQSMTFAGDIPEGWSAQLMCGSPDDLAKGAGEAARQACPDGGDPEGLALLVSCIGRRLMMGQRVSDEVEVAAEVLESTPMAGFYSYGEICPHNVTGACNLHNQTMTVTVIRERKD